MILVPMDRQSPAATVKIPLTDSCFRIDPEDCECLIIEGPAIEEAFKKAVNGNLCKWDGDLTLDLDPWGDGLPTLSAEASVLQTDGYWFAPVALTDDEIRLVLLTAYPELKHSDNAEAYNEAFVIEQWKSTRISKMSVKRI